MSWRRRAASGLVAAAIGVAALAVLLRGGGGVVVPALTRDGPPVSIPGTVTPRAVAGNEVFGFLPYWEMDEGIAAHLRATPLTTLALFSVTNTRSGAIDAGLGGYRRISDAMGATIIAEAQARGTRVEVVFSSFGRARNGQFFGDRGLQDATIASLVGFVDGLDLDGVDVDVEAIDAGLIPAYGAFVGRLRAALVARDPSTGVSVATAGNTTGAAMAAAALTAGADQIFLMGYDYHWSGSGPGASAPLDRRDGDEKDLAWSLDLYAALGIPVERTILGLPLYGMAWPVAGPALGAPAIGRGEAWIPRRNASLLLDPLVIPLRDEIEGVEVYVSASDGSTPPPPVVPPATPASPGSPEPATPAASATPDERTWRAVYVDSPATLAPKLALARARGLAGAGFWAIGYERGLPAYTDLIARFAAGKPLE